MDITRRLMLQGAATGTFLGVLALAGCSASGTSTATSTAAATSAVARTPGTLALDAATWQHDADNDVYYQLGTYYVTTPAAEDYENLAIFVPGAYLDATDNGDGTYTATVSAEGTVAGFTAATAPVVLPINTPGYAAQQPLTSYSYDSLAEYLEAGFVYVAAGIRGRDSNGSGYTGNAPWGVTDVKAVVRFVRYNAASIPGSTDAIFVFGHSGGGAQSSIVGASGDAELFTPYLESLGAALTDAGGNAISDGVAGVMAWCPITSLDIANAAYEWNMGQFGSDGTRASGTWTEAYSKDLAAAFPAYIEALGLADSSGAALTLDDSSDGVALAGSYYDHVVSVVTRSLNDFLAATTFPYTPSTTEMAGMDMSGEAPSGEAPSGEAPADGSAAGGSEEEATTYETVDDYIAALNADTEWVSYDASTNTATITGLEGFVLSQKSASKDVGAFDGVDRAATENVVLGIGEDGLHFSETSRDVLAAHEADYASLSGWDSAYASSGYDTDLATTDEIGVDVATRTRIYDPLYFLSPAFDGYRSGTVAPSWRIRTGIMQGDTASTTEINLALALQGLGVGEVDFATVWGQGHTQAELTGSAATNFIDWVKERVA